MTPFLEFKLRLIAELLEKPLRCEWKVYLALQVASWKVGFE
jgi:hypothetical protein